MAEFKSWLSYEDFAKKTKHYCRYILSQDVQDFLDIVLETSKKRHRRGRKGTTFYRSQLGLPG